jgi:hypothetical protein
VRTKRPKPGTIAARVWHILDMQRQSTGDITATEVYSICKEMGLNRETVHSAIGRYKKHYGMQL